MPPKSNKKKKVAYNAFYYFMIDFRKKEESRGVFYNSLAEVTTPAGIKWETMDSEARAPYEQKAKEAKNQARNGDVKYTTTGQRIDHVLSRDEERERSKARMENYIQSYVGVDQPTIKEDFVDKVFYVVHVNYYCEVAGQDRYYPAEIAAVRFNLRHGVDTLDTYHVIFNTGEVNRGTVYEELPIGYRLMAETVAKESHQIPPPPHKPELRSSSDIKLSFSKFIEFLRRGLEPNEKIPPIYVEQRNEVVVKNVFNWLLLEFGYEEELKVYSLPFLFFCLRNAAHLYAHDTTGFVNQSLANHELERDIYDYVRGICCPYHGKSDAYPYCSLSIVTRQVYIICDFCCPDMNIDLIPGSHVPKTADVKRILHKTEPRPTSRVEQPYSSAPSEFSDVESVRSAMANTTISENVSTVSSRKPKVQSRLLSSQFNNVPDLENDFPSLPGGSMINRPGIPVNRQHMPKGRGRGRILQK